MSRTASFRTESEGARQDVERLKSAVNQTSAELVSMQRTARLPGGMTDELQAGIKATRKELQGLKSDLQTAKTEYEVLSKVAPPPGPKTSDDADRYQAWQQAKAEERERERRAQAADRDAQPSAARARYEALRQKREEEERRAATRVPSQAQAEINKTSGVPTWEIRGAKRGGGSPHGEGEHDGNRMAGMEAGHSVRSMFDMMGAGQSFGQASKAELPRLLQAAGVGLGTMIGIEAATGIISGISNAIEKAREFKRELAEAFSGGGMGTSSGNALRGKMGELAAMRDKIMPDGPSRSIAGVAGEWLSDTWEKVRGRKTASETRDDQIEGLEQRRVQLSEELARRKAEQVALDKRAAIEGEAAVAIDRERLGLKERIAAVMDDKNLDGTAQAHMIDSLREESKLREENIRLVHAQHEAEAENRHADVQEHSEGVENPVTKAENALKAATQKRDAMLKDKYGTARDQIMQSDEYKAADDEVTSRGTDVRETKTAVEQRKAANARQANVNSLAGYASASEIEHKRLADEERDLTRQVFDPKARDYEKDEEKRKGLAAQLLQNRAEQTRANRGDQQRAFQRREDEIREQPGRGDAAEVRSIESRLSLNHDRQEDNGANENDADVAEKLKAEAAELLKRKEEILQREKESLQTLQQQTTAIQQQGYSLTAAQKHSSIGAHYDQQIEQAKFEGKSPAYIADMERQRDAAQHNVNVDEEMMTPGQKRRRDHENARRQQADRRASAKEGKHPWYDGSTKAHEADGNSAHATFQNAMSHAHTALQSMRPDAHSVAPKTAQGADFKTALAPTERLLADIKAEVSFQEK